MDPKLDQAKRAATLDIPMKTEDSASLPAVGREQARALLARQARQQTPSVGQRVTRTDSRAHGLGETRYIDDLSFPGMLHAKVLRSTHPHARVLGVDTAAAEAMPGVVATLTGKEIPVNSFGPSFQDQPLLADDKVRHMGDGIAAVAAVTEQAAMDALEKIKVEYEPLPAVFDPLEAMTDDAPKVHDPNPNVYATKVIKKGDLETAFAASHAIIEGRYTTQMVEHVPLEPHASIAQWDSSGRVTVWSTLGRITLARADMARTLRMPLNRIRIIGTIVGGNFGGKNEITLEPVVALLSKKTGKPVKSVYSREDEFISSTTRHPLIMEYKTGVSKDGRLLARQVRLVCDGGAYCSWSETTLGKAAILSAGPYNIDNLHVEAFAVYTNKTMTGAMRGFGAPQVCFAYESHMDEIAHQLGIDPLEIRLLNAFDEGSLSPTGQVLHSVAVKACLTTAVGRFGWKE